MRAWLVLALDPLIVASRRRILWIYLIASTLVAAVAAIGLAVSVEVSRDVVVEPGRSAEVSFDGPLVPGSVSVATVGAAEAGPDALSARLGEDEAGALVGDPGLSGTIDRARGVVTLVCTTTAAVGSASPLAGARVRAEVTAAIPLIGLRGEARAALLAGGRATRLAFFGFEVRRETRLAVRPAVPVLVGTFLYSILVWALGSFFGVILGLFATADAVSSAFEPGVAELLLSRPVGRAQVVLARFAGAVAFAAIQAGWLLGLALLIAGLRLGVWAPGCLLTLGPLLLKFATLLAVTTLAATATRTTVLGLAAALAVWACSYAVEKGADNPVLGARVPSHVIATVERVVPLVTRLDDASGALLDVDVDLAPATGPPPMYVVGQCAAWTLLCLGVTTALVSRRDH